MMRPDFIENRAVPLLVVGFLLLFALGLIP